MKITQEFATERFRQFNDSIFEGALPEPPIILCNVKTFLGKCTFKIKRKLFGKSEYYDFKLRFNQRIDLTEEELEDIIIHEMIHYHIEYHHIKDSSAHGKIFRKMMNEINSRYHRHITITHQLTDTQREQLNGNEKKENLVAVITFKTGKRGIKILPSNQAIITKYCQTIESAKTVQSVDLYLSTDSSFNRYPKSAAFNVFRMDEACLDKALTSSQPLTWKKTQR